MSKYTNNITIAVIAITTMATIDDIAQTILNQCKLRRFLYLYINN